MKPKRALTWLGITVPAAIIVVFGGGLWFASNQLLFPSWQGASGDLSVCTPEVAQHWGEGCGNLRDTRQFRFTEERIPSPNGYDVPGWLVKAQDNGGAPARGAIMLIHAGGSDRREGTRYVPFFLSQDLDVLSVDLGCHGEAPCPVPGLTYGQRESRDVIGAYLYLTERYDTVYAMGSSVGAASILVALPEMPRLAGAIAENPMTSFSRLIKEAPESQSMPGWATDLLIDVTMLRGRFDGRLSPEHAMTLSRTTPVFFIHSTQDEVVSFRQTQDLADRYAGPKTVWLPEEGSHAAIWDADHAEYERRLADFLVHAG